MHGSTLEALHAALVSSWSAIGAGRTCHGHPPFPGTPGAPGSLADVVEEASVCWSWHSHSMIMSPNAVKMKAVASALRLDPTPYTDLVWHGASAFLECWQLGVALEVCGFLERFTSPRLAV